MMNRKQIILVLLIALFALIIVGGVLGTILRLISELRYALEYFLPYWLVGPIIFLTFGIIVVLILQLIWPNIKTYLYKRKLNNFNSKYPQKYSPKNRKQAAEKSLENIDRLIERLHKTILAESLRKERERVEKELSRGDLFVVIFGTGSSGKTSLIRALLNEIIGNVSPAMGATKTSESYRLRLKGLDRGIQILDTPGILEGSKEGFLRQKEAITKAGLADLLIVVVDGDLRSSEKELIERLSKIGKKLFLVLNKCDLRGEAEVKKLIESLKRHTSQYVAAENVIPTSASPQTIPLPGTKPIQPLPEINMLVRRLAKVLHEEGEELLADNILLQCQNLDESGRRLLDRQRQREARSCVDKYAWISSGVIAITPLPGLDLIGAVAINAQMIIEIAKVYGVQLTRERAQELAVSLGKTLASLGIIKGSVGLLGSALSINLPTIIVGRVIQSVTAAWLTRVAGASFITYFQRDQDWGDGGMREVVQHHYDLNRRESTLRNFIATALEKVVDPIQKKDQKQLPPRPKPQKEAGASDL